jgi:hypothetical protein
VSLSDLDGANRIFHDPLVDELVGEWNVTGKIAGQDVRHYCSAEWVLNHQFLRIYFKDVSETPESSREHAPYEAYVFLGYDNTNKRYVMHWMDIFGARFSETLGFGKRNESRSIKFVFEDKEDGSMLHNTLCHNEDKTWNMLIEQKNENGGWDVFANETLRKKLAND